MPILDREEYIEQAYLYRVLCERMEREMPTQELLTDMKQELLASTKLPLALDYLAADLKMHGRMAPAMERLKHYFSPFQTFLVAEAENDRGKFDLNQALRILEREAQYRSESPSTQGLFLYNFECICRNRLNYDRGLTAIAADDWFDANWREWILFVRKEVGFVNVGDLIYLQSDWYRIEKERNGNADEPSDEVRFSARPRSILFGEKEGRIAAANRQRDPLLLFAALHRHLGYPIIPRVEKKNQRQDLIPALMRRIDRLESRIKMIDDEQKGTLDLTKLYVKPTTPPKSELDDFIEGEK